MYLISHNFVWKNNDSNILELNLCEEYLKENPNQIYAISRRAFLNGMLKNYDAAISDYLFLLNKYPTNTKYIIDCVQCYLIQKENEKAKDILESYYENLDKDVNYYG